MLNCRDASRLISQRQDRPLGFRARLALRLHLWMCVSCRRFARQIDLIRLALRGLGRRIESDGPGPDLSPEARARIRESLAGRDEPPG